MAPKRPAASSSTSTAASSPKKKKKDTKNGQADLSSFIKSPVKDEKKAKNGHREAVIDLLSDADEADVQEVTALTPSPSTSKVKADVKPKAEAVIDLDDLDSEEEKDEKPKTPVNAFFAKRPKAEEAEDVKPDVKGKGKAKALESPGKLVANVSADEEPPVYPLDIDIFAFDPASHVSTQTWPRNPSTGKVHIPYSFLVAAFVLISATRARLTIVTVLTNTLRTIVEYQPEILRETVYLITNHVAPAYEGVELGIGSQVIGKALKAVSGVSPADMRRLWNKYGDVGDVAFEAKSKIRTLFASQPLTISSVFNNLVTLTGLKGQGTVNKKADIVQRMLVAAKGEEVRFLGRTLVSHLRIGAVRLTVTASLARAFCLIPREKLERPSEINQFWIPVEERKGLRAVAKTTKEGKDVPARLVLMQRLAKAEALVREVYVRHPNYDSIVPALLSVGLQGLSEAIPLSVGVPLSPMLGQITRDLGDVAERLEPDREFAAEWKYDGQRVQIHCERREKRAAPSTESTLSTKKGGGQFVGDVYVRLFSRHLEDMTAKYPDILQLMPQLLSTIEKDAEGNETGVQSFIMDAEIVAIDPKTKELLDFQTLANRARKDVNIHEVKVKVGIFAFDLMYLNGQTLISKTFRDRRQLLKTRFPPREPSEPTIARFDHVKSLEGTCGNLDPVRQFMLDAISEKCEGLMLKLLDSAIVPASAGAVKGEIEDEVLDNEEAEEDEELTAEEPVGDDVKEEDGEPVKRPRKKALLATYEPDKRVESWLKVKRDYGDLGDSFDLVPVGAWHGQGRHKAGWWSPILLAVYSPDTGGFQGFCKCISGFTDAFYKDLNVRYPEGSETCSSSLKTYVDSGLQPSVWWQPSEVWEVRGASVSLSPVYTAGLGLISAERGLSLRFPRFIKRREDKSVEQATTPEDLAEAFRRQSDGHKNPKVEVKDEAGDDEEDKMDGF